MIILVYSETNDGNFQERLGCSEYSYYFVLKEFLPILKQLGMVIPVTNPEWQVDPIYHSAIRHGQSCVFLCFAPPHQTPLGLDCPTIPIFAWEFDTIPTETWLGELRDDWRHGLRRVGRAITHSNFAVGTVRKAMGPDFPIVSIPAPVWDRYAAIAQEMRIRPAWRNHRFDFQGMAVDTRAVDLHQYSPQRAADPRTEPWPHEVPEGPVSFEIPVDNVIYTSIFNPYDGRKNLFDMVCGFVWALRDREDATLIMKATHYDSRPVLGMVAEDLYKLTPYKCRIILVDGYLDDETYRRLAAASTYVVNTSHGEGQCLPLMEFMSCGKPAISPRHTAMADYIDESNAFVLKSSVEPSFWPHDPRLAYRTQRHRINFETLVAAYRESYRVAKEEPQRYARMSERGIAALERHCSEEVTLQRLRTFLGRQDDALDEPRKVVGAMTPLKLVPSA
jgi:glycosyltransferase involved in cell wall biosynthesis